MTAIEHQQIKGLTLKNLIVSVFTLVSITGTVLTTYFNIKEDIGGIKNHQDTVERVYELRLKILESQVSLLQQQIHEINDNKKPSS